MPYFRNDKLLLIHIPKTGGSSLEQYFSKKYKIKLDNNSLFNYLDNKVKIKHKMEINSSLQHLTYETMFKYKDIFGIDFSNIITIVRNPYERLVSDLFACKLIGIKASQTQVFSALQKFIESDKMDNHNLPQYVFITNENKELLPNMSILHTETLNEDMHNLGYTDFNIHQNCNKIKTDYYLFLNNDSIKLINEFYDYDFTLFNYKKIATD